MPDLFLFCRVGLCEERSNLASGRICFVITVASAQLLAYFLFNRKKKVTKKVLPLKGGTGGAKKSRYAQGQRELPFFAIATLLAHVVEMPDGCEILIGHGVDCSCLVFIVLWFWVMPDRARPAWRFLCPVAYFLSLCCRKERNKENGTFANRSARKRS